MNPNHHQQAAIDCDDKRIVLLAGAGSGKTATLTQRIARLLGAGWHPSECLAVTFTRAAAAEMRGRLEEAIGPRARRVRMCTLHSLCVSVIREWHDKVPISREFSIYDERDEDDLLTYIALERNDKTVREGHAKAQAADQPYRLAPQTRRRLLREAAVVMRLQQLLREAQALTYDGLETTMVALLQQPDVAEALRRRWRHVLVDECQDLSAVQHVILKALAPEHLFLVGDIAQSIYGFRGARVDLFQGLVSSGTWTVLELPTNYRSLPPIVEVANRCAAAMAAPGLRMDSARAGEDIWEEEVATMTADSREGLFEGVTLDVSRAACPDDENPTYPWTSGDMAILSPTWHLLEQLSPALEAAGVPHRIARRTLDAWESREARWVVDVLRVTSNPWDHLAVRRVLGHVETGSWAAIRARALRDGSSTLDAAIAVRPEMEAIGAVRAAGLQAAVAASTALALRRAELLAAHLESRAHDLDLFTTALQAWLDLQPEDGRTVEHLLTWYSERRVSDPEVQPEEREEVVLVTIHGAKGLEWPCVWLIGCEEGYLPRAGDEGEDLEEARRLFYVALTRARDRLRLCWAGHRERSRFLGEVERP